MNPPYARSGNVGRSILMGHLPDLERRQVLEGLGKFAARIKSDLGESFGNAGLAPKFACSRGLRSRRRPDRLRLPRSLLGGVWWEGVREFLTSRFRIDHIVVCDDPNALLGLERKYAAQ